MAEKKSNVHGSSCLSFSSCWSESHRPIQCSRSSRCAGLKSSGVINFLNIKRLDVTRNVLSLTTSTQPRSTTAGMATSQCGGGRSFKCRPAGGQVSAGQELYQARLGCIEGCARFTDGLLQLLVGLDFEQLCSVGIDLTAVIGGFELLTC